MRICFIYTLINPNNNEIFYIGCTYDMERRLKQHINDATYYSRKPLKSYFDMMNCIPLIEAVDEVLVSEWEDAMIVENYWIDQFRQWGFRLMNNTYNLSKQKSSE